MRTRVLLALAAVLAFGAPAEAGCVGCGGAAAPGSATLSLKGYGRQSRHALTAECTYKSTPSGSGYAGSFIAEAIATSTYDPQINVAVSCYLQLDSGNYSAQGTATGSNPYDAKATGYGNAPPLQRVQRLCLAADANWHYGSDVDSASVRQCISPGLWAEVGDVSVLVPLGTD